MTVLTVTCKSLHWGETLNLTCSQLLLHAFNKNVVNSLTRRWGSIKHVSPRFTYQVCIFCFPVCLYYPLSLIFCKIRCHGKAEIKTCQQYRLFVYVKEEMTKAQIWLPLDNKNVKIFYDR